jgi:hypothetical protein
MDIPYLYTLDKSLHVHFHEFKQLYFVSLDVFTLFRS